MLVRSVVDHQIHDQPHSPFVYLRQQTLKILHGAELFHNLVIIPDVITVVVIGGIINRREPESVRPQPLQIVQLADDPRQIADPIPVAVAKTSGINLIKHRFLPPLGHNPSLRGHRLVLFCVHQI